MSQATMIESRSDLVLFLSAGGVTMLILSVWGLFAKPRGRGRHRTSACPLRPPRAPSHVGDGPFQSPHARRLARIAYFCALGSIGGVLVVLATLAIHRGAPGSLALRVLCVILIAVSAALSAMAEAIARRSSRVEARYLDERSRW